MADRKFGWFTSPTWEVLEWKTCVQNALWERIGVEIITTDGRKKLFQNLTVAQEAGFDPIYNKGYLLNSDGLLKIPNNLVN